VGLSKKDCGLLVDDLLDLVEEGLLRDGKVKLTGFGSFVVHEKSARRGRNPHTEEDLIIAARRVVTFRPSKVLRAALNLGLARS
jgi:integration host factor subunit alpha